MQGKRLLKTILWMLIASESLIWLLRQLIPIEFTSSTLKYVLELVLFWTFFASVVILFILSFKKETSVLEVIMRITFGIGLALAIFFGITFSAFAGMCSWVTTETLYVKKDSPGTTIIIREFGCGATDSSAPIKGCYKSTILIPGIVWLSDVDTTNIDQPEWIKVN